MIEIKTHPELNRLALKHALDSSYLVWAVLRDESIALNLSSHFTRESAYTICQKQGLSWNRRHFNRILIEGRGTFWGDDGKNIFLRSFERVYKMLADDTANTHVYENFVMLRVEVSSLARRAELYWSWLYARGEQTIARATLHDLFNISADQQRNYQKYLCSRLIVHTNYCHIDADLYKEQLKNIPTYSFSFLQERFVDNRIIYVNVIAYQLPNTYFARAGEHAESAFARAPKRAKYVLRTLYGQTGARGFKRRWWQFYDDWEQAGLPEDGFIRTAYQGTKHIYRSGHFF